MEKQTKRKLTFTIFTFLAVVATNTAWYFIAGPNIPKMWSVIFLVVVLSPIWKVSSKKIILAGIAIFSFALPAILFKNYILANDIADLGFLAIVFGTLKKFGEMFLCKKVYLNK